jgi:hypothetical protein
MGVIQPRALARLGGLGVAEMADALALPADAGLDVPIPNDIVAGAGDELESFFADIADVAESVFAQGDWFHGKYGIISGTTKRAAGPTANAKLTREYALFSKVHPVWFNN